MSRVKRPSYIITTIIGSLILIGLTLIPPMLDNLAHEENLTNIELLVLEQSNGASFVPFLEQTTGQKEGINIRSARGKSEVEAYALVLDEGLTGLLLIDDSSFVLLSPNSLDAGLHNRIEAHVNEAFVRFNAAKLGLSHGDMQVLFQRISLDVREISPENGHALEKSSGAHEQALLLTYFLLFMLYMALILYGNMVASGVAEEKSSRIMEVMVSTVKPTQLMFGKIIGVGALGLVQFAIWVGSTLVLNPLAKGNFSSISLEVLLWFGLYFILGYFFYASIFAAGGALVSRVEEVNQVITIFMMFIVVGFFVAFSTFDNPNGKLSMIASFIPFTAPMVMFSRVVLANPSIFQVIASIVILILSFLGGTWISAKVYHVGILLYGKRPNLAEIVRLLRD